MEMKVENVLFKFMATMIIFSCLFIGSKAQEQQQRQQCTEPLRFCISYLNNTDRPPDSCCQPLDYIVKSLPNCFCSLISTWVVNRIEMKDTDVSKAQTLPSRCGQRVSPLECFTGAFLYSSFSLLKLNDSLRTPFVSFPSVILPGSSTRSNNPSPNSANSKLCDYSSFVIAMVASSLILGLHAL